MPTDADLEIYKQRYDTFRHLDRVRYQAQNLAFAFIAALIGAISSESLDLKSWAYPLAGIVSLLMGYSLYRINLGVVENSKILALAGNIVGDDAISELSINWRSATTLSSALLTALGVGLLIYSIAQTC